MEGSGRKVVIKCVGYFSLPLNNDGGDVWRIGVYESLDKHDVKPVYVCIYDVATGH